MDHTTARIATCSVEQVAQLGAELSNRMRSASSLESAAQCFVQQLTIHFPSVILARVFATLPFSQLCEAERRFAVSIAGEMGLSPTTAILTLLGTAGTKADWNDRHLSRTHLAIPLLTREGIDDIPMVSRLLSDLRFRLSNESHDTAPFVTRAFANINGIFYVPDAGTTLDEKGRKIVPAAEFVREGAVRSVFGFGGSYVIQPMFVSTILFTQEYVPKQVAMNFLQLSSIFKAATTRFVTRGLLFDSQKAATRNG
ncbi:MAG: hypothetical protein NVSMB64_18390 [Candidatus Velthaea sp.]